MNNWNPHSPDRVTLHRNKSSVLHHTSAHRHEQFPVFYECISKVTVVSSTMETNNFLVMLHRIGVNAEMCNKIHNS